MRGAARTGGGARRRPALAATLLGLIVLLASATAASAGFQPMDPQEAEFQDTMTWEDYVPVPGTDWANPALTPSIEKWKVALVLTDFADQPFNATLPAFSTVFGNPQPEGSNVPEADVPEFYREFLNTPSLLNHFTTMNSYWMEDSLGRYGVELDAYGVYHLTGNQWEYWLRDAGNAGSACPTGFACNRNARTEGRNAWIADVGIDVVNGYDNVFYVQAGQDESSTWQEFGEMIFQTMDDVTDEFGNPDPTKPNWAPTRYIPWTSFAAAKSVWPSASGNSSTEGESSGMGTYAHELSHNLGIGDNYNNPYGNPLRRSYTGPWDMLSRGSFNGPGGPHKRWLIPSTQGGSLGSNHNLRNRMKLGLVEEDNVLRLDRNELDDSGPIVAQVTARAAYPGPTGLTGLNVALAASPDLADPNRGDQSPPCSVSANPDCPGPTLTGSGNISQSSLYNNYSVEVIDRIGNDSFQPDYGVLVQRTKNADSAPFVWTIDAHPEDMDVVDFYRPDGTPAMISYGDFRQLNDALFHAGLGSGSGYEYVDEPNRLHFYVINNYRQGGVRSYQIGVRSLDGSGPQERGVKLGPGKVGVAHPGWTQCEFSLKNTGKGVKQNQGNHPENVDGYLDSDIYRVSAEVSGGGWSGRLYNALATARFGKRTDVQYYVERTANPTGNAVVTMTATSESDPTQTSTATCTVRPKDVR
jgi:M6 family metalloprotease-like protein